MTQDKARPRRFITVIELAQRWSVSRALAYRLIEKKALPSLAVGASIRVPLDAVEQYEREQLGRVPREVA